ncbi:MAG: 2-haloacrylate reductase [Candidatus Moanabacter tarae]|uniref:2-haloacrylate reductase n=1 Tax=Candidatus Moanibacter tarae TaxID=2200854 RepID=A0A2Z4AMD5_9BACT|nr:MAG: 2-haloacrylate reductase [Candidatus Moanabacter tarae]|tara:strand:+ start:13312 stop:14304 length:993 start_codon:yes stop_codon:yes gene_type:complete
MKAILIDEPGPPSALYVGEAERPEIGEKEILVRIEAAGVNRADAMQREGLYPPPLGASPILGLEMAGKVEEAGSACSKFQKGDSVFALLAGGGYAEYVAVDERLALPIPENMDFVKAAGIAEVFLTAYQALRWLAGIEKGNKVLIHAGASGVGTAAVQLVRYFDCSAIVTVGSTQKLEFCKSLGAAFATNYREEKFVDSVKRFTNNRGVDIILDFIGGDYFDRNLECLAPDGCLVMLALLGSKELRGVDVSKVLLKRLKIIGSTLRNRSLDYKVRLVKAFEKDCYKGFMTGELQPIIDRTVPFDEATDAHEYLEANRTMGKVILTGSLLA